MEQSLLLCILTHKGTEGSPDQHTFPGEWTDVRVLHAGLQSRDRHSHTEEQRLERIRLATGQRSSGQHRRSFQIHCRIRLCPPQGRYLYEDIFMHTHTRHPTHPRLTLKPSLNSYFKPLLMLFSQQEAETFY